MEIRLEEKVYTCQKWRDDPSNFRNEWKEWVAEIQMLNMKWTEWGIAFAKPREDQDFNVAACPKDVTEFIAIQKGACLKKIREQPPPQQIETETVTMEERQRMTEHAKNAEENTSNVIKLYQSVVNVPIKHPAFMNQRRENKQSRKGQHVNSRKI